MGFNAKFSRTHVRRTSFPHKSPFITLPNIIFTVPCYIKKHFGKKTKTKKQQQVFLSFILTFSVLMVVCFLTLFSFSLSALRWLLLADNRFSHTFFLNTLGLNYDGLYKRANNSNIITVWSHLHSHKSLVRVKKKNWSFFSWSNNSLFLNNSRCI